METQQLFNIAIGLIAFFGGWVLNSLKDSISSLRHSDSALADKVQGIELLVAGQYIRRDELKELTAALFHKLDTIETKLDKKADKP